MADNRKRGFWHLSCNDILGVLCAAAVPIALGIYTAITYQQEQEQAQKVQDLSIKQTIESRQDVIYDQFLHNVYNLDKDGYLNESKDPWAFANAYYRAAHRQLDPVRKGDMVQFLKEKQLIGRDNCTAECQPKKLKDIIRLNELNFDNVHFKSQTGMLNPLNLDCVSFDQVSMSDATFSYANLNGASFDHGRLDNVNFGNSSLACASFDGTDLRGVDFGNANLKDVVFSNVDLSTTKLTADQKKQATFSNVTGLNGITKPTTRTTRTSTRNMTTTTITKKEFPTTQQTDTTVTTTSSLATTTTMPPTIRINTTTTSSLATTTTMLPTIRINTTTTIVTTTPTTTTATITSTTKSITLTKKTTSVTTTIETTTVPKCSMPLITFDDIPGQSSTSGVIPNGYKNLTWNNAEYINVSTTSYNYMSYPGKSPWRPPFVMHNPNGGNISFGAVAGRLFSFMSFQLTSIVSTPHTVTVYMITGSSATPNNFNYPGIFTIQINCPSCINIESVLIHVQPDSTSGVPLPSGSHLIVDDICAVT